MDRRSWLLVVVVLTAGIGIGLILGLSLCGIVGKSEASSSQGNPSLADALAGIPLPEIIGGNESITGRVNTEDWKPMEGVIIQADMIRPGSQPYGVYLYRKGEGLPEEKDIETCVRDLVADHHYRKITKKEAVTDEKGNYQLSGLADALYRIRAFRKGYRFSSTILREREGIEPGNTCNFVGIAVFSIPVNVLLPDKIQPEKALIKRVKGDKYLDSVMPVGGEYWSPDNTVIQLNPGTYKLRAVTGRDNEYRSELLEVTIRAGFLPSILEFRLKRTIGIKGNLSFPEGEKPGYAEAWIKSLAPGEAPDPEKLIEPRGINRDLSRHCYVNRFNNWSFSFHDLTPGKYLVGVSRDRKKIAVCKTVEVTDGLVKLEFPISRENRD